MGLIKKEWMPNCSMKRVICHWTAGGYEASSLDRAHYHILIEREGGLVRGTHSIDDNVRTQDGVYAAHTRACNTGSIGVTVCCMLNARETPFSPGPCPMTETQWRTMAQVVAELCQFYGIPVTPRTVLGHGEVEANLGIEQHGKWDPMVLPWKPTMSRTQVGILLRTLVQNQIEGGGITEEETPASVIVRLRDKPFPEAILTNETSYVRIRPAAEAFGWTIESIEGSEIRMTMNGAAKTLPLLRVDETGYVSSRDIAEALALPIAWDPETRIITIG